MDASSGRSTGLRALLRPGAVAVVGASPRPGHFANQPLVNLRQHGFAGKVYPVNPRYDEVLGLPCFPSVASLPEVPDLAVVVVRPDLAVEAVAECGRVGVGAAVVVAAGFAETGDDDGVRLQEELLAVVSETGIRVCGPNTLGVANFNASTVPFVSGNIPEEVRKGAIAIVSQSGGCGFTLLNRAWSLGIGVGHLAVAGNEIDVRIPELIAYYLEQEDVRTVLCYMEAVRDVAGLRRAGELAAETGKSIFVMKTGATALGQRAAAAHTGALATSDAVCGAALEQWGLVRARTFDALVAAGALAARYDPPESGRLGVYAQGGGLAVVTADLFADAGLDLPELDPETVARIKALMPDTTPGNPFDSGGQFLSSGVELLVDGLTAFAGDPNLDAIAYGLMPVAGHRIEVYAEGIARTAKTSPKPSVVLHYRAGSLTQRATEIFDDAGLLVLDPPEAGIDGLGLWLRSRHVRPDPDRGRGVRRSPDVAAAARALVDEWKTGSLATVPEHEAVRLLQLYDLPVTPQALVGDATEAADAAARLDGPYAVKVSSPDLPHRSDIGGVVLGLEDPESVARAFDRVVANARTARADARIVGATVATMAPPGVELILGVNHDQTFGPVLLLGFGGIWAEVLRDVQLRLPPLTLETAAGMVQGLRGAPLLTGARGAPPVDLAALGDALVRLSEIALDLGDRVSALDLNPVIAYPDGLAIVDALVELPGR